LKPLVCIIEDDKYIRSDLVALLEHESCEVRSFAHGKDAWDALDTTSFRPKLIILDLVMPVMDGYEFCKAVFEHHELKLIPALMLSSDRRDDPDIECSDYTHFMEKPIDLEVFLDFVHRALKNGAFAKPNKTCASTVQK